MSTCAGLAGWESQTHITLLFYTDYYFKAEESLFFALIIIVSQQLIIIALNGRIFFINDLDYNFWERVSVHKLLHIQGVEAIIFAMDCYHRAI